MSTETELSKLTSGRRLARNAVWNLVGEGAPLLVALVAISRLVHALGTQRVGILTLVWMLIGYLSLLDLGVGCAFTNLVAQKSGAGEEKSLPPLILTANILMRMPETELRNLTCGQAPEVAVARGH